MNGIANPLHRSNSIPSTCLFTAPSPISCSGDQIWEEIQILNIARSFLQPPARHDILREQLKSAWALLLRNYVGQDEVAFGVFRCFESEVTGSSPLAQEDEYKKTEDSYNVRDASECDPKKVQLVDNCPLNELGICHANVNTALLFCQTPYGSSASKFLIWEAAHQNFDLVLLIDSSNVLHNLILCLRKSRISVSYGEAIASAFTSYLIQATVPEGSFLSRELQTTCATAFHRSKRITTNRVESCVHTEILKMVQAKPDAESVCSWDGSLSYAELDLLSSNFAMHLVHAGCRPGILVLFMMRKSLWAVVAALGILKAGGAIVPLDTSQPESRMHEIWQDTNAQIIVTSHESKDLFNSSLITTVVVDAVSCAGNGTTELKALLPVAPNDPIFVLFTSGSTGKPKGIVHEHAGICSHAAAQIETMGYEDARVFQFSAFIFDVAMMDIFTTLMAGGCVCLPSESERISDIPSSITRMRANHAMLTPSVASLIDPEDVPTLRILALAGEKLGPRVIDRWVDHVWLMNAYGPAEVGVCTVATISRDNVPAENIGVTLPHCTCWVVDSKDPHRLAPPGSVGELLLTGTALARGYLNNKCKTEASFIRGLQWAHRMGLSESTFYKTGDLVRYNMNASDGSLDYIGRVDTQIKIRGQRIELGEIEHYLATIPGVVRSMVSYPKQGCYAEELVAIIQVQGDILADGKISTHLKICNGPGIEDMQTHLARFIPSYMLPSQCIAVEFLPLNLSCKIDRKLVDCWVCGLETRVLEASLLATDECPFIDEKDAIAVSISVQLSEMLTSKDVSLATSFKGRDVTLDKLGLDSIQMMSLVMFLQRKHNCCIKIHHLLRAGMTVTKLAQLVHDNGQHKSELTTTLDPFKEAESILRDIAKDYGALPDTGASSSRPIRNVCLSGGTGYLGLEIIRQLLLRPEVHVFALVRCATVSEGLDRVLRGAYERGWWKSQFSARLHIWQSDLQKPNLGLSGSAMRRITGRCPLTESIDTFIHCGARVQYLCDYQTLKPANVDSTVEVLRFLLQSPTMSRFLYVSGGDAPNIETGHASSAERFAHMNGYSQSKFVSELVVANCARLELFKGKQLRIVKPGYIIGSISQPRAAQTDFLWRLVSSCLNMKAYNSETLSQWLYMSDIEYVAQLVIDGIFNSSAADYLPALDGLSLGDLWELLKTELGYHLEANSEAKWFQILEREIFRQQESHPLFPFLSVLKREIGLFGSQGTQKVSNDRVKQAVLKNVQYLIDTGSIHSPHS